MSRKIKYAKTQMQLNYYINEFASKLDESKFFNCKRSKADIIKYTQSLYEGECRAEITSILDKLNEVLFLQRYAYRRAEFNQNLIEKIRGFFCYTIVINSKKTGQTLTYQSITISCDMFRLKFLIDENEHLTLCWSTEYLK